MSQLDSELIALRIRLASLEEQKKRATEIALEKKSFPLKALEEVIDNSKKSVNRGCGKLGSSQRESYIISRGNMLFLEPILDALKNINERLEALENKIYPGAGKFDSVTHP
jgi:hypothetical protein